ncbi:MAG: aspartate/glutamate racemase family protein [Pseudomonadota bacterium]
MKTIGLIGGMSWESTVLYYQTINEGIKQRLGGLHSGQILLASVDFDPIEKMQAAGDWAGAARVLADAASRLDKAGADAILICTNTMHKVAPEVEAAISVPLLHIADATGEALVAKGCKKVALLGTAFTMEQAFYKDRLVDKFALEVLVPNDADRQIVHEVIYHELCLGQIVSASRDQYLRIIDSLVADGAEVVILGCTEIGMLVQAEDTSATLLDTTHVHAERAVEFLLS